MRIINTVPRRHPAPHRSTEPDRLIIDGSYSPRASDDPARAIHRDQRDSDREADAESWVVCGTGGPETVKADPDLLDSRHRQRRPRRLSRGRWSSTAVELPCGKTLKKDVWSALRTTEGQMLLNRTNRRTAFLFLCPPLSAQRRMLPTTPVYNRRHCPVDEIKQREARPVDNSRRKAPRPVDVNFPEHHPYPATGAGKKEGTGQYLDSVVDGRLSHFSGYATRVEGQGGRFPSLAGERTKTGAGYLMQCNARRATGGQFPSPAGPLALWEKNEIRRSVAAVQIC
ncbi:hypothetical protein CPLU01_07862 [Colletotrichum plurivorum]|uniref:Uncharacterized protein n=1 Tax=Colletotrichum plurivorum TaxID=2175906 RepID=A0A8H6NEH2_9PEZI|nr:hypothetical protein CPLU01_07862 [Colletotrichum plurivorum]